MPVTARMRGMLEQKLDGVLEQPLLDLATDVSGDMVTLCAIREGEKEAFAVGFLAGVYIASVLCGIDYKEEEEEDMWEETFGVLFRRIEEVKSSVKTALMR